MVRLVPGPVSPLGEVAAAMSALPQFFLDRRLLLSSQTLVFLFVCLFFNPVMFNFFLIQFYFKRLLVTLSCGVPLLLACTPAHRLYFHITCNISRTACAFRFNSFV